MAMLSQRQLLRNKRNKLLKRRRKPKRKSRKTHQLRRNQTKQRHATSQARKRAAQKAEEQAAADKEEKAADTAEKASNEKMQKDKVAEEKAVKHHAEAARDTKVLRATKNRINKFKAALIADAAAANEDLVHHRCWCGTINID